MPIKLTARLISHLIFISSTFSMEKSSDQDDSDRFYAPSMKALQTEASPAINIAPESWLKTYLEMNAKKDVLESISNMRVQDDKAVGFFHLLTQRFGAHYPKLNLFDGLKKIIPHSGDVFDFWQNYLLEMAQDDSNDAYAERVVRNLIKYQEAEDHLKKVDNQDEFIRNCSKRLGLELGYSEASSFGAGLSDKLIGIQRDFKVTLALFDQLCLTLSSPEMSCEKYKRNLQDHFVYLKNAIDSKGSEVSTRGTTARELYVFCVEWSIQKHFEVLSQHLAKIFKSDQYASTLRLNWETTINHALDIIYSLHHQVGGIGTGISHDKFFVVFRDQAGSFINLCLDQLVLVYNHRGTFNKFTTSLGIRGTETRLTFDRFVAKVRSTFVSSNIITEEELEALVKPYEQKLAEVDTQGYNKVATPVSTLTQGAGSILSYASSSAIGYVPTSVTDYLGGWWGSPSK